MSRFWTRRLGRVTFEESELWLDLTRRYTNFI